jgi:glutathione S-transferase
MADSEPNYVLYHHASSICSIMVRYCYALRGSSKEPPGDPIRIREESVDIFHEGQLTEHYLCDINPFGEVPTLAPLPVKPGTTIPDSLKITLFMAQFYPSMIPNKEVEALLRELHAINYYSLTFTGKPETVEGIDEALEKRLDGDIDDRYRDAINFKLAQ